jgi:excisionase family DNA binding protein
VIAVKREPEDLLRPGEVAELFRVKPGTVAIWAEKGILNCIRTVGGHRRYRKSEVLELLHRRPDLQGGGD